MKRVAAKLLLAMLAPLAWLSFKAGVLGHAMGAAEIAVIFRFDVEPTESMQMNWLTRTLCKVIRCAR